MGKASSRKKIQRARRAVGGPAGEGRGDRLVWPLSLAAVLALGAILIVFSRGDGMVAAEPPRLGDHWHEAYGVYVCDAYLPPFPDNMATSPGVPARPVRPA